MNINLTKDAEYMLCALYREYKENLENGSSKTQAKITGSSNRIHKELMGQWSLEDVDETCCELSQASLLNCTFADDVVYHSTLSSEAIVYMENRFKNGLKEILDYMVKIKTIIFPV